MSFVKYEKFERKKYTNKIGIHPKGRIVFYKSVLKKHLFVAGFIEIYYDPENNKIGILPVAEETEHTLKIHGKITKMVCAQKFFNRFKIKPEKCWYEYRIDGKMLVIQL